MAYREYVAMPELCDGIMQPRKVAENIMICVKWRPVMTTLLPMQCLPSGVGCWGLRVDGRYIRSECMFSYFNY